MGRASSGAKDKWGGVGAVRRRRREAAGRARAAVRVAWSSGRAQHWLGRRGAGPQRIRRLAAKTWAWRPAGPDSKSESEPGSEPESESESKAESKEEVEAESEAGSESALPKGHMGILLDRQGGPGATARGQGGGAAGRGTAGSTGAAETGPLGPGRRRAADEDRSFLLETVELLNVEQNADNADIAVNAEIMQTYYR